MSLDRFASVECNALSIFAQPNQAESKISFKALPRKIEEYERASNPDGKRGTDTGI
jgi:hypothetical protein